MKKSLKLLLLLSLIALMSMLTFTSCSLFQPKFEYSVNEDGTTCTITRVDGFKYITIPSSIDEYRVTGIGGGAFNNCIGCKSIKIPDSITNVDSTAFPGYVNLKVIKVDSGNKVYHSKGNCLIETATKTLIVGCQSSKIPADGSVTSIGDYAFQLCAQLKSITIPNCVTSIGCEAFFSCIRLTEINIPDSVTSIGESAFYNCVSLTNISVDPGNKFYQSAGNCLVEISSKTLIAGCQNSIIPTDGSVTSIGESAFYDCTGLTSITIPDSITNIGDMAFFDCENLKDLTISQSVTSIGSSAFFGCDIASIAIPDSVTYVGAGAFSGCKNLTSITVDPDNTVYHSEGNCLIETASKTLVAGCQSSIIPTDGSVTSIGESAFSARASAAMVETTFTSWGYSSELTGMSDTGARLTSITIPDSVTSIGDSAFLNCDSLTSITIPNSVTSIGEYAFRSCTGLTSITIPDSVTSIGDLAFEGCSSLNGITFNGTKEQWYAATQTSSDSYIFTGDSITVHCTDGDTPYIAFGSSIIIQYTDDSTN